MKWKMSEQINITVGHSGVKLTVMLFVLLSDKQNLFDNHTFWKTNTAALKSGSHSL